jgi:hypothetical protein
MTSTERRSTIAGWRRGFSDQKSEKTLKQMARELEERAVQLERKSRNF